MIEVSQVSKTFGNQRVLDEISFRIEPGEIFVILGESGTGKSVLLKSMMGLIKPDQGTIVIDGQDITQLSERQLLEIRKNIGYLFQEGALYDFMDVFDNVAFPLREHTKMKPAEIRAKVQEILGLIDLHDVEHKLPSELSGGMKKRVALARAIIYDSKILFCDEPTSGLDPIRSRDISDLIRNVAKQLHCTTVITSHDLFNSFRIADRLMLIKEGKVEAIGTPTELRASGKAFFQDFVSK